MQQSRSELHIRPWWVRATAPPRPRNALDWVVVRAHGQVRTLPSDAHPRATHKVLREPRHQRSNATHEEGLTTFAGVGPPREPYP